MQRQARLGATTGGKPPNTTTPLQALSLLNNEFIVDQAARFARRVEREAGHGHDMRAAIRRAWRIVYSRAPREDEILQAAEFSQKFGMPALTRVLWNSNRSRNGELCERITWR